MLAAVSCSTACASMDVLVVVASVSRVVGADEPPASPLNPDCGAPAAAKLIANTFANRSRATHTSFAQGWRYLKYWMRATMNAPWASSIAVIHLSMVMV